MRKTLSTLAILIFVTTTSLSYAQQLKKTDRVTVAGASGKYAIAKLTQDQKNSEHCHVKYQGGETAILACDRLTPVGKKTLRRGDSVIVISGKDKSKTGKITRVEYNGAIKKCVVKGINIATIHGKHDGIFKIEAPMACSSLSRNKP